MSTALTVKDHLMSEKFKAAIAEVLPDHITPDRMARTAITAISRTPNLAKCDSTSILKCMMDLSQWGLEPDGRHAHLIPFKNNRKGTYECQLIIDYKGLVELAFNSGKVSLIHADVVYVGDVFEYDMGTVKRHVPWYLRTDEVRPKARGEAIAAYCVVELKGGVRKTEVMSKEEIESIRSRSRAGNSGPWVTDWSEMAKKTVFRRVSKWIPLSAEVRDAFDRSSDMLLEHGGHIQSPRAKASDLIARIEGSSVSVVVDSEPEEAETAPAFDTWEEAIAAAETREALIAVAADVDADETLAAEAKRSLASEINTRMAEVEA